MANEPATWTGDYENNWLLQPTGGEATDKVKEGSAPGDVDMADYIYAYAPEKTVGFNFTTPDVAVDADLTEFLFGIMVLGTEIAGDEPGALFRLYVDGVLWASAGPYNLKFAVAEERVISINGFSHTGAEWNGKPKRIAVISKGAAGGQHPPPDEFEEE